MPITFCKNSIANYFFFAFLEMFKNNLDKIINLWYSPIKKIWTLLSSNKFHTIYACFPHIIFHRFCINYIYIFLNDLYMGELWVYSPESLVANFLNAATKSWFDE
jgi:hypothetical protein